MDPNHFEPVEVTLKDGRLVVLRRQVPDECEASFDFAWALLRTSDQVMICEHDAPKKPEECRAYIESNGPEKAALMLSAYDVDDAQIGGRVLGNCSIRPLRPHKCRHIRDLGIGLREDWRGVGLGRALMTHSIAWCKAHPDITRLTLSAMATNDRGIPLYRSLGFVEEGILRGHVRQLDGTLVDERLMAMPV